MAQAEIDTSMRSHMGQRRPPGGVVQTTITTFMRSREAAGRAKEGKAFEPTDTLLPLDFEWELLVARPDC